MFRFTRRRPSVEAGVRFCDPCAAVSTAHGRARRRYDETRAQAHLLLWPR
jgi:hypothetical protein